jgi:beta-lactamase regulating signal transducer with metallopeptidase domain
MATVLAVLAASVGAVCRRPALVHALWLLVLLKLVTPPFVSFSLPWLTFSKPTAAKVWPLPAGPEARPAVPSEDEVGESPRTVPNDLMAELLAPDMPSSALPPQTRHALPDSLAPTQSPTPPSPALGSLIPWNLAEIQWRSLALGTWLGVSLLWFVLAVTRIHRFRRALGCARMASRSVRELTRELAHRLGLSCCPEVWFVPGRISPLVWSFCSRPRLYLPAALWQGLDEEQRATLLVHELAHLGRHDSWVRGLELVATSLYWWHPVVWWSCRELREAEEQCCDAWVVWAFPKAARAYATALMKTVDFLSETQTALPAAASGMGPVHDLRRRLTMIMRGTTPRRLSGSGLLAMLALGAFFLPLLPTWAQQNPDTPRGREPEERKRLETLGRRLEDERAAAAAQGREARSRAADEELARSKAQVEQMAAQVQQAKAQLEAATAQLKLAQERLIRMEVDHKKQLSAVSTQRGQRDRETAVREPDQRLREVEKKLDAVLEELQSLRREIRRTGARPPAAVPGVPGRPVPPGGEGPRPGAGSAGLGLPSAAAPASPSRAPRVARPGTPGAPPSDPDRQP